MATLSHPTATVCQFIDRAIEQSSCGRNSGGFWLACQLRDNGFAQSEAETAAEIYARAIGDKANKIGCVQRDEAAAVLWHQVYEKLSDAPPGDFGKVTSRSEAQVMRLSLLYALLDGSEVIRAEHLQAALAVWDYAEHSAAYIFDSFVTDPTTRRMVEAIGAAGEGGLTRTEIHDVLGRHVPAGEIQPILEHLKRQGKVESATVPTGGRPVERWRLSQCEETN